jgi:hypothetical protein
LSSPQQEATPPEIAQVWAAPQAMVETVPRPLTIAGVAVQFGDIWPRTMPFPSCPKSSPPQHQTAPPTRAHTCCSPAAIALADPDNAAFTGVGTDPVTVVFPS